MAIGTAAAIALGVGTAASAGASVAASRSQAKAAERAASIQQQGEERALNELARQYDTTRADFAPYRETGIAALDELSSILGLPARSQTEGFNAVTGNIEGSQALQDFIRTRYNEAGATDLLGDQRISLTDFYDPETGQITNAARASQYMEQFRQLEPRYVAQFEAQAAPNTLAQPSAARKNLIDPKSLLNPDNAENTLAMLREHPGYQFRLSEGLESIDKRAAALGRSRAGDTIQAAQRYGEGLAADEFGNYFARVSDTYNQHLNQLAGVAGVGQVATGSTAAAGQAKASQAANTLSAGGAARAGLEQDRGAATASGYVGATNAVNDAITNAILLKYLS